MFSNLQESKLHNVFSANSIAVGGLKVKEEKGLFVNDTNTDFFVCDNCYYEKTFIFDNFTQ